MGFSELLCNSHDAWSRATWIDLDTSGSKPGFILSNSRPGESVHSYPRRPILRREPLHRELPSRKRPNAATGRTRSHVRNSFLVRSLCFDAQKSPATRYSLDPG
jgi:hypothetical protein